MTQGRNARFRIGMDFREGFRENPRGIGLYCRHLMREYGKLGPEMDFELYHERPAPPDLPEIPSFMHPNRLEMRGSRFHLWERIALPLRIQGDGLDLFHGTYNTLPPRLPLLRGPRLVVTLHDVIVTWLDANLDDPFVRYVRRITPRVLRQADAVITVSEFSRQDICTRFSADPGKIHVVHNGIHPIFQEDASPEEVEAARNLRADGRPFLFALGSSLGRKNTDILFPCLRKLIDSGVLAGELLLVSGLEGGALRARRAAAERAGVSDRVRLLGYLSWTELRSLYTGAELSVYPSLAEGWGIPVVESLACGTPVATSGTTAMPEAGGEHAYYFDPECLDSVVDTVETALRERASFARSRDEARDRARSFAWEDCARQTLALFAELCS